MSVENPKVLVVDDSAIDRRLLGTLLERLMDCSVTYAEDGAAALEAMKADRPDLVITDMQMPGMDGLELLQNANRDFAGVPVIIATAHGNEETAVRALQQGAASYIPKSALYDKLAGTVEAVLVASAESRTDFSLMRHLNKTECVFVLQNSLECLPSLINYLQQPLVDFQLCDAAERVRVGVALEEAIKNAFVHGTLEVDRSLMEDAPDLYYQLLQQRSQESPYREREIRIEGRYSRSQAIFTVQDEGPGFDHSAFLADIDPSEVTRRSGRGLVLMRMFLDEVQFNDSGNQVTLIKRKADG